ncbi:hypothetical protein D8Y22_03010 [Salinadaptatus halalkaliphilus]|uniref:Uncharacterized protein n=1 Tax=Salinadaptatus halalkaliphilus TaxID=2419781 RepID=A0A4S3TPH1_9EURY|nr:DUF5820 family protein [Salinadaptatus halalkaliphilus]THE66259.1 hypothetical protein D8Y22_03010 [Salinadaptatus halalkaliphilus]
MVDPSELPAGWELWNEGDDGRLVLAYRPDIFDAGAFPAPCLPTLYVTHGKRTRRPGRNPTDTTATSDWFVTLYAEPEVPLETGRQFSTRADALADAMTLADRFGAGEIDYRGAYQVPREPYLEQLDELTGRDELDTETREA